MGRRANGKAVRSQVKGVNTSGRGWIVGLSLLEVLVSLGILSLFLLGGPQVPPKAGLALYVSSLKLQAKAKEVLTAAWLAKGKFEEMGATAWEGSDTWKDSHERMGGRDSWTQPARDEEQGIFPPPHERYTYRVQEEHSLGESPFGVVILTVTGPTGGRVTLRVLKRDR